MTEGISKERLLEIAKAPINKNNEELQFILRWLITTECADLDPWLPIDENTPKDRSLLLLWPQEIGGAMQGCWICDAWYCDMWELTGSLMSNQPTHYKLLPEDPK